MTYFIETMLKKAFEFIFFKSAPFINRDIVNYDWVVGEG